MKTLDVTGLAGPIVRVKIINATSSSGAGLTGLTNASGGLVIAIIADNASATTPYTSAGSTIDTIGTLGIWAAPTTGHCRFAKVDDTNHPGVVEIQFAAALWATLGARRLIGTVQVTGGVQTDFEIQLTGYDLISATAPATLATAQPNYAPATATALAAISTTLGTAGAGLTAIPYTGPSPSTIQSGLATSSALSAVAGSLASDFAALTTAVGSPAQASQIPANFTSALFASAGVFSTGALANAPTGAGASGVQGTIVAGSTVSSVTVSGLPSGYNYATQRLYNLATGEARVIVSQAISGGNYVFAFGTGSGEAGPFSAVTATNAVIPVP